MKNNIILIAIVCFILASCNNGAESTKRVSSQDSTSVRADSILIRNDSIRMALWAQYDSISKIEAILPDSLSNATTNQEIVFYTKCKINLNNMKSDIRNQVDSILLGDLKIHVTDLTTVIEKNTKNLKRIEKFTSVLSKVSRWITNTVNVASILISKGLIKPKISSPQ